MVPPKKCYMCGVISNSKAFAKVYREREYTDKFDRSHKVYSEVFYELCDDCAKQVELFINKKADEKIKGVIV